MSARTRLRMTALGFAVLALLLTAPACTRVEPAPDEAPEDPVAAPLPGRTYERVLVFSTTRGDSTLLAAWRFDSTARPGGVDRSAHGWLLRAGAWEAFHDDSWETPPTSVPWRLLPHGPLRLIVGMDDALERVAFLDGARRLEIVLGTPMTEWAGRRGTVVQLSEAALRLGDGSAPGIVLDLNRVRETSEGPGGEWLFLTSGDSLQLLLQSALASDTLRADGGWRGWARMDFRDIDVPQPVIQPVDVRAFEPARRDIPVAFLVSSPDSDLDGELEAVSFEIAAREGEGPVLPIDGMLEIAGSLTLEGRTFVVRGVYAIQRSGGTTP